MLRLPLRLPNGCASSSRRYITRMNKLVLLCGVCRVLLAAARISERDTEKEEEDYDAWALVICKSSV